LKPLKQWFHEIPKYILPTEPGLNIITAAAVFLTARRSDVAVTSFFGPVQDKYPAARHDGRFPAGRTGRNAPARGNLLLLFSCLLHRINPAMIFFGELFAAIAGTAPIIAFKTG